MAYQPVTFTAGEVLTATKMNAIGSNMAGFNDGTAIGNEAISTSKIADEAVSSSKIDWKSVQAAALPVAATTTSIGYGINALFMRIGNLVIYSLPDTVSTQNLPDGGTALSETLPTGYRPSSRLYGSSGLFAPAATIDGASPNRTLGHKFMPDGSIFLQVAGGGIAGVTRYSASATWITDDDYPTADIVPTDS